MFNARKKIAKPAGAEPTEFEAAVAQALFDLEATNAELKTELRDLFITGAREIDVSPTRKAVMITVRASLQRRWHSRLKNKYVLAPSRVRTVSDGRP